MERPVRGPSWRETYMAEVVLLVESKGRVSKLAGRQRAEQVHTSRSLSEATSVHLNSAVRLERGVSSTSDRPLGGSSGGTGPAPPLVPARTGPENMIG